MNKIPILKSIWPSVLMGVLLATIPGLYIGKVLIWRGIPFWFWTVTAVLTVGSLFVLIKLIMRIDHLLAGSTPRKVQSWGLFVLCSFFFFVMGFILMGYFWRFTGRMVLASAKNDVLAAGFQLGGPEKTHELPDDKNSVYLFNQAWNAPSMRKFGSPTPIFDKPPQGRFEENTRMYGPLESQDSLSNQPFFGKKTEWDFLIEFNKAAAEGRLTLKQKNYAHKLLKEHEDAFRLIDLAFETKSVDWGIDYHTEPYSAVQFSRGYYFFFITRLLRLRAYVQAMDGNAAGAVKSVDAGLFFGDMIGRTRFTMAGVMIDAAIVRFITPLVRVILPRLQAKGYGGVEILPFLQPEKLREYFKNDMEYELFGRPWSIETSSWLDCVKGYKTDSVFGLNHFLTFLFEVFYYPFELFDEASGYETNIQRMKDLTYPRRSGEQIYQYLSNSWLLSIGALPRFDVMTEKVNESMTHCALAKLEVEAELFHQQHKRWPNNGTELEKWSHDKLVISDIPEVKVTGAFAEKDSNVNSPVGNQVTLARKGETPNTDGSGWLYDSNSGTVYVNSTVHDSQNVAYSFYGFE